jgi:ATP-dependent helicase HrpB
VLRGAQQGELRLACELAAILGDRDPVVVDRERPSSDLAARVRLLRGSRTPGMRVRRGAVARLRQQADRLERQVSGLIRGSTEPTAQRTDDPERAGRLVAQAWPDRVAGGREGQRGRFLLASGRGATLPDGDLLAGASLLAVAHLDRGAEQARIHLAAAVDPDDLREVLPEHLEHIEEVAWRDGDVRAERREALGAVVLTRSRLEDDSPARRYDALLEGLRREGLDLLRWDDRAHDLRARVAFVRRHLGDPWPDWSDEGLDRSLEELVGPFLVTARRRADLATLSMAEVFAARLTRRQTHELDRLAPTHLTVPSGSRRRIEYPDEGPVLRVRIQEVFGSSQTPTVLDGQVPVLLHLLSPAGRPMQITDDLAGFWERSYPSVRSELRGRYPKHAWPEDPTAAPPLRGTPRR